MYAKLEGVEQRFIEVEQHLSDPGLIGNREAYQKAVREHSDLGKIVVVFRRHKEAAARIQESRELLNDADAEIRNLAKEELAALTAEQARLESDLLMLLVPRDPNDDKNVILEIRAGTGGDEAGLFASDLFRMYCRYAEGRSWKIEILSGHPTGAGGVKEAIVMIQGKGAYSALKYESGTHRVQRVPATEAQGRIHTSTATVAVLPEVEEVEIEIDPGDLQIDVYGSSGPGGQHMQKNATAVRLTHKPTGLVVSCESERSQTQNKERAMSVLRARLYEMEEERRQAERGEARRLQVGTAERSEKIRTYNYPQNRVTDHRIGLSIYRLESIMNGDIDEFIDELATTEQAERLQAVA